MDAENIIAINVPNAISIGIMVLVFGVVLGLVRKFALSRMGGANSAAAAAQATVPGT